MVCRRTIAEYEFILVPSVIGGGSPQKSGLQARPREVTSLSCAHKAFSQCVGAAALSMPVALGQVRTGRQRRMPALDRRATSVRLHRVNELVSVGAKAPPSENVSQSVVAAGQCRVPRFVSTGTAGSGSVACLRPLARSASVMPNRDRGRPLLTGPLPHHPACGSAPGGSRS